MMAEGMGTREDSSTHNPVMEELPAVYDKWVQQVKATVPADRLLVHAAQDGWKPLCQFLESVSPQVKVKCDQVLASGEPYPHVFDKKEVQRVLTVLNGITLVCKWAPAVLVMAVGVFWYRK